MIVELKSLAPYPARITNGLQNSLEKIFSIKSFLDSFPKHKSSITALKIFCFSEVLHQDYISAVSATSLYKSPLAFSPLFNTLTSFANFSFRVNAAMC